MKKLLLLALLLSAAVCLGQDHTVVTLQDTQTITGAKTIRKPILQCAATGCTIADLATLTPAPFQVAIVTDTLDCLTSTGTFSPMLCSFVGGAWTPIGGGGGGGAGNPGGSGTQLQYRNSTSFGGITGSSFVGGVLTLPATSVVNTGVYTNTQMNLYVQSLLNGCSPLTEFQLAQTASNYSTDAGTFCIKVLGTSTVYEANALTAYAENNSTATNAVALYPSALVNVNNGKAWPINPIAMIAAGVTGATIQNEFDLNVGTGSTGAIVYGINLSGIWNATPATSFGVNLGPPGGTAAAKWQSGFITQPGAAISAFTAGPSCPIASLTCAASPVTLQSYNGGVLQAGIIGFDTSGNFTFAPKSGSNTKLLNGALILPNGGLVADNNTGGIQITPATGKTIYLVGSGGTTTVDSNGSVNIPAGQTYQINATNLLDTDAAMAGNSSTRAPSQSAVTAYVLARTGSTTSLSALTNPTANKSFDMAADTLNFGWSVNTGANNLFTLTDFASNTGTGYLANFPTAASSTLKPFRTCYRGTTDCVVLNTTTLTTTGATVIDATKLSGNLPAISGASLTSVDAATLGTHAAAFFQTALGFTPAHADLSTGTTAANVVSIFNSGTCSGYLKSDGTCDNPVGSGTVTHTGGALTLNKVMLGAGVADSKVDSALTSDGAGTLTGGVSITSTAFVGALTGNASTATAATTVTNADDTTTNADFYPLFTPTVGGNFAAKVSSTKLTFHPSTGLLTAPGFSGALTGNVTGNASGTAATITGSLTGAVTSTGMATVPGKLDVGTSNAFCADAGASDTYACNLSPAITAYVTGTRYRFKANTANTGAASINFNAVGALTIKKVQGAITTDLADNDIRVGQWVECVYDGTNCQMVSPLGNNPSASLIGTDTQVVFFDGANNPVGNSQMTYNKTTNVLSVGSVATTGATADVFTPLADGTTANSFWLSSSTANVFKAYVGSALKQFAFTDSNITGTAASITGAVTLANTPLTARGDILVATTATPILGKLAKGTQYQTLQGGATDPLYDALHLDQATAVTGNLPWGNQAHTAANVVALWTTCTGYLKNDGTCDVPTGAGTVTHTGGALTLNKVMLGAGTADSKVDSVLTSDGAGTITGGVSITSTAFVGALTGNASGTAASITGSLTGDVTSSGMATTLANIPTAIPVAGTMVHALVAAPSTTASKVKTYADSTDLRFHDINASGVIGTTVVADTGTANNFLTAISAAGAISKARPTCSSLSDAGTGCAATIANYATTMTVTTSTPITVSTTSNATFHVNEHATAATAITYNLPTAAAAKQFCFANGYNGSAANTGALTIATSASGQFIIYTDGTLSATGGNVASGGAAGDAACVVGVDATHWLLYVNRGTWTKN